MTNSFPSLRQQQRNKFRAIRNNLSANEKQQASAAISRHLATFFAQQRTPNQQPQKLTRIAAYLNSANEASLDVWIAEAWQHSQKQIFVPVVEEEQGQMGFYRYAKNTQTVLGHYNLRTLAQPEASEHIAAADLDCVLLPLLAFDKYGTRLGMGGGYYDRFFSSEVDRPYLLGVCFDAQQSIEPLEKSHWDVALDAVITESGFTEFNHAD
jgi:5-formyltetrahydrofolate cyclo-ligase